MGQPDANRSHPLGHLAAGDGSDDVPPPSYEASTAASTSGARPSNIQRSPRSSSSSVRSHHGLLPVSSPPPPQPQPTVTGAGAGGAGAARAQENTQGYAKTDPMYWETRNWDDFNGKPGCCGSSSGGCCFSSRGGCCFSDRAGCCFSDREGCCFSDRGGCCGGDTAGAMCSTRGACCCS